ncbi:MAG: hypothetical protein IPG71_07705 [bacterium]|nr:hypothetical protein [bacterium]
MVELSVVTNFDANWGTITMEARFFETDEEPLETAAVELYLARVAESGATFNMEKNRGQLVVTIKLPRKTPSA